MNCLSLLDTVVVTWGTLIWSITIAIDYDI